MRNLVPILLISLALLFGCAMPESGAQPKVSSQNNASAPAQVAQTTAPAQKENPASSALVGNDRDSHGCIGSAGYTWCESKQKCLRTWEENCTAPSAGAANNASERQNASAAPAPLPNVTQNAAQAPPAPIIVSKIMRVGDILNFTEGSVKLDDIWIFHESEPALITIRYADGRANRSIQAFPSSEVRFVTPQGRRFWIFVGPTQAASNIYFKRVQVYAFDARDNNTSFDWKLYQDIIGNPNDGMLENISNLGREISRKALRMNSSIPVGSETMMFEELDCYPANQPAAIYGIYLNHTLVQSIKVPQAQAYVLKSSDGKKYAIYYDGSFVDQNKSRFASAGIYEVENSSIEGNRLYSFRRTTTQAQPSEDKLASFALPMGEMRDSERDFYISLIACGDTNTTSPFAAIGIYDSDKVADSVGIARKTSPLHYKNQYGKTYELWLRAGCGSEATIDLYRTSD